MVRYKIVFKDGETNKTIYGEIVFEDALVKVISDYGNIVYVNKANIVFMKELKEDMP